MVPTCKVWFKKYIFSPEILVTGVKVCSTVVAKASFTSSKSNTSIPVTSGIDIQALGAALLRVSIEKTVCCSLLFALIVEP